MGIAASGAAVSRPSLFNLARMIWTSHAQGRVIGTAFPHCELWFTICIMRMIKVVVESGTFKRWIRGLRDKRAVARINARLRSVSMGNLGDARSVGDGVSELRVHYGPGYRIYCIREGATVVVLLCGGEKSSQRRDIEHAKRLAKGWR